MTVNQKLKKTHRSLTFIALCSLSFNLIGTETELFFKPGKPTLTEQTPWKITIKNASNEQVTLRIFTKPAFVGAPAFQDITIQGGRTKEITTEYKITGIAPTDQTVVKDSWTALDIIIENPENNSLYTIDKRWVAASQQLEHEKQEEKS